MNKILSLLLPSAYSCTTSLGLAFIRISLGILFAIHGFEKFSAFDALATSFPDPLGIGSAASLSLAIFGELVCGIAFALGLLTRLAVIPMIITMGVAFFVAHSGTTANGGELSLVYLLVFVGFLCTGAGSLSLDGLLGKKFGAPCSSCAA